VLANVDKFNVPATLAVDSAHITRDVECTQSFQISLERVII